MRIFLLALPIGLFFAVFPASDLSADCSSPACQSAARSLGHLRQVMDEFHNRFSVYEDIGSPGNHFHARAMIPNEHAPVRIHGSWIDRPHSGATATRCELEAKSSSSFGGFYFLNGVLLPGDTAPRLNFGTYRNAGLNLSGATALTFWARGALGGEIVEFFTGGVGWNPETGRREAPYPDSSPAVHLRVKLTPQWRQYRIDLRSRDLRYVLGGFGWAASAAQNPQGAIFFLDDIEYELSPAARRSRLEQPRFLRSFRTLPFQVLPAPVSDFDHVVRNAAHTYDNALALLAFLADGSPDSLRRARLIGDALVYAIEHDRTFEDGRVRDAYAAGDIALPPGWLPNGESGAVSLPGFYDEGQQRFYEIEQGGVSTGNNAWAMLALLALHRRTGAGKYLEAARGLGEFIRQFRSNEGTYRGFRGGIDEPEGASPRPRPWASTEHNLDVFAAFTTLRVLGGDASWKADAGHARRFVVAMWDSERRCNLTGTTDPEARNNQPGQLPADVQAWAVLAIPRAQSLHSDLLACAERNHRTSDLGFSGFDFNEDRDGVWFEGTAHLAVAYALAGRETSAEELRRVLRRVQATPFLSDGQGIPAASHDGLSTGFGFLFHRRLHVGATAWNVFAQLRFNPFYAARISAAGTSASTPGEP